MKYIVTNCDMLGRDNQCKLSRHSHYVECQDCTDCTIKHVIENKDHFITEPIEDAEEFCL